MKPSVAQLARRWAGAALKRLLPAGDAPHRPDFSESGLREMLAEPAGAEGERCAALAAGPVAAPPDPSLVMARRARELLGPRFFVAPAAIPALWQQLGQERPHWFRAQIERTARDAEEGIPVYSAIGPTLGSGFPWSGLPEGRGSDTLHRIRPHRFAFAPRTGLACLHDAQAARRLREMLGGWIRTAGGGASPDCFASNLLVIQRVLALSWCWAFLAARPLLPGPDGADLELLVLRILRADIRFLEPRLGQSTPNNHLLADRFAGWYLRMLFPELLRLSETGGEARWRDELLAQSYPDGGSFEHSAHYHEFACEMGAAYLLLCRRQQRRPDPDVEARVGALLRFQLGLTGPGAIPLAIGNGTEDTLFPLDVGEGWCPASLRELYRALFDPGISPAPDEDLAAVRAYWLLGGKLAPAPAGCASGAPAAVFPDSGFYVQEDPVHDARLVFRTGPRPGAPVAAGHMHADLLGIYLSVSGRPVLVDAGTYTYRRMRASPDTPDWRAYFAGPEAHNGLAIAGHDPLGKLEKDFRKLETAARVVTRHHAHGHLDLVEARLCADGPYDGLRRTCLHLRDAYWLILDDPTACDPGACDAWYGFQCAAGSRVSAEGHRATIRYPSEGPALFLTGDSALGLPAVLEGSTNPLGGWVSPAYGALAPAPQLRYGLGASPLPSAFLLAIDTIPESPPELELHCPEAGTLLVRVRTRGVEDVFVHDSRPKGGPVRYGGVRFEGRLVWLRLHGDRPVALEWLEGRSFSWAERSIEVTRDSPSRQDLVLGPDALSTNGTVSRSVEALGSDRKR